MKNGHETYTGFLEFRGIDFSFVFSGDELSLIPFDKSNEIRNTWLMKEITDGVFVRGNTLLVEEKSIVGTCNENAGSIVFLPKVGSAISGVISSNNSKPPILKLQLLAYILCRINVDSISKLAFSGPEINYIHPVNQGLSWQFELNDTERGVFKIKTSDYMSTTTEDHVFTIDGKSVVTKFGITRSVSLGIDKSPLSLKSSLIFELDPTNDYGLILKLYWIAKEYISYLCYRKNVVFDEVELFAPYEGGKRREVASLFIVENRNAPEEKAIKSNRCIRQVYIDGGENRLLQDIADNRLYTRHLPDSYSSGRHIDASRFVMITAAFEWEFNRMHPEGVPKSEKRQTAEETVVIKIEELRKASTGKVKEIYRFLKTRIGDTSLQEKLINVCTELDPVIGIFGKHLYAMNHEELVYKDMGKRLSDQRNHYAHGDLDKDFIGKSLLDLVFLEYVVYAMQMKYYGISDECIKKAINELFHLNFAI